MPGLLGTVTQKLIQTWLSFSRLNKWKEWGLQGVHEYAVNLCKGSGTFLIKMLVFMSWGKFKIPSRLYERFKKEKKKDSSDGIWFYYFLSPDEEPETHQKYEEIIIGGRDWAREEFISRIIHRKGIGVRGLRRVDFEGHVKSHDDYSLNLRLPKMCLQQSSPCIWKSAFPRASDRLRNRYSGSRDAWEPPSAWQRSFGLKNLGCIGAEETGCAEGWGREGSPGCCFCPSLISCWTLGRSPSGPDSASSRRGLCLMVGNISSASKITFCVLPEKPYSDEENYPFPPFYNLNVSLPFIYM